MSPVRGLNDGEYQLVPPWLPGQVGWPGGCGVGMGRPFASSPLAQLTFTNGVPKRKRPFVRSST